jgi:aldehyde oxidoreductase
MTAVPTATGQVFASGVGIKACLEALRGPWARSPQAGGRIQRGERQPERRGAGHLLVRLRQHLAAQPLDHEGRHDAAGTVWLHQGAMDIGQGSSTVMTQIMADALGVAADAIRLKSGDTDITPDAGKTSASRQTFVSGNAARLAGEALREQLLRHANVSADAAIRFDAGTVDLTGGDGERRIDLASLERRCRRLCVQGAGDL